MFPPNQRKPRPPRAFLNIIGQSPDHLHNAYKHILTPNPNLSIALVAHPDRYCHVLIHMTFLSCELDL